MRASLLSDGEAHASMRWSPWPSWRTVPFAVFASILVLSFAVWPLLENISRSSDEVFFYPAADRALIFTSKLAENRTSHLHTSIDGSTDRLVHHLLERMLKASAVHRAQLGDTMLGKPGHLVASPRASLPAQSPLRSHPQSASRRFMLQRANRLMHPTLESRGVRLLVQADGMDSERDRAWDEDMDELPPVLEFDWRDFRANLVAQEGPVVEQTNSTEKRRGVDPGWMFETPLVEQGNILLGKMGTASNTGGFALKQQYYHKCVILVLAHEDNFTKGVILNRPTALQVDGWPVWYGGDVEEGGMFRPSYLVFNPLPHTASGGRRYTPDITCLHRIESEAIKALSTVVIKDIYNISFDNAKALVAAGEAKKEDFWVFVGYAGWGPGQLQRELDQETWYLAAADSGLLLSELLTQARDPSSFPRVDSEAALMKGGDGIATWERLITNIGRTITADGFADRMLREWVREYLTEEGKKWPHLSLGTNASHPKALPPLRSGTVLVSSRGHPFLLDKQYLHKAILVVLERTEDVMIAAILNRPRIAGVTFDMPGIGKHSGKYADRRISFGGELSQMDSGAGLMPLHYKRELGGPELGDSGLFLATSDFTGTASDLIMVSGLLAWVWPGDLERQVVDGAFAVVPPGKVPWERIWELSEASKLFSTSLQERITDVRRSEQVEGAREVLKDTAVRVAKSSCEVWEAVMSEAVSLAETSELERQLADEALLEWYKFYATTFDLRHQSLPSGDHQIGE
eukprot:gnl/TRDRNA2_/TRDRNA2_165877_c2_seq2.p1 gnl/TRDRNA2_/TRDRNA2_165877_c2~~gnl/TRDRNA2_/TRDRNA2_165877_c2_seq2.p1  ORF type:complete len:747 (-),score=107.35 gnl/TRDRNA2_/TRDRNA2_165877_c2_seq2:138-2378(-)